MTPKKILIVCRFFYPVNNPRSHRATELAKEFARQGHRVTVLTPKHEEIHDTFAQSHGFSIVDLGKLKWRNYSFGKSRLTRLLSRSIIRVLQLSLEYPAIELALKVNKALKKEQRYDVLISVAVPYPVHWGVAWCRTTEHRIAKTWIADCGDPYVGDRTDTFRKWFHFNYIEKWFMRKTDYITIPVETAREGYFKEFQPKIKIIPQGFKIEPISTLQEPIKNKIPHFAYAGGFIPNMRDPRKFLDFLATVNEEFKFIVYTSNSELIMPYQQILGDKLSIREYIPRNELLVVMSQMDFLVNFDNNTGVQVPSKLIDYAMIEKSVLNIQRDFDPEIVLQFISGNYNDSMELPDIEQYRIENVCQKFLELND